MTRKYIKPVTEINVTEMDGPLALSSFNEVTPREDLVREEVDNNDWNIWGIDLEEEADDIF